VRLAVAAMGVVFGDIGTSPLYALKEIFHPALHVSPTPDGVLGALSLIFWSLLLVVTFKYVTLIMRADNHGEGGIMALASLASRTAHGARARWWLTTLAILGAALFYGDSVITPAISVLSAVEGLQVETHALAPYVAPIALLVLAGLFALQRAGTARVAALFGPIMCGWFLSLAALGLAGIAQAPQVLAAVSPLHAVRFMGRHGWIGLVVLGAVVLAVTGAEALYAGIGHLGRRSIRAAWYCGVLPALVLNYFGQGALLLARPEAVENPFYLLAPGFLLVPMVALATLATVIASQAVISGAFSVARQAIQLDYCPRMSIEYTSETTRGQIYVPVVNWCLFAGVVLLVLVFRTASNLASAYGFAVTGTMLIDTLLFLAVARGTWRWPLAGVAAAGAVLLAADVAFFAATSLKIVHGGWFPLALGAVLYTLFATWRRGRQQLRDRKLASAVPLEAVLDGLERDGPHRVPGTAVFFTETPAVAPRAMLHNLKHNKVLHERVVVVTLRVLDVPRVPFEECVAVERLRHGFYLASASFGFKDRMDIRAVVRGCRMSGLELDPMTTSFFVSREIVVVDRAAPMPVWRQRLFAAMTRLATSSDRFLQIPTNRVLELGAQGRL